MIFMKKLIKDISSLIQEMSKEFKSRHLSLVTAESCTGGGLAYFISKEPSCSSILERGYVTYSNQAKESVLEVSPDRLQICGAVSKEVAQQMALGALNASTAQIAIATSGIAGEDYNPPRQKGLLWVSCAGINKKPMVKDFYLPGAREKFTHCAILTALKLLHQFIKETDRDDANQLLFYL